MLDTLYAQVGTAISLVVVAFAFLKGDEPERVGAGAFALGLLASLLLQDDGRLSGPQWGVMSVDVVMLGVYAALAWKSRRSWPVWAGALQALIVMSHLLTVVDLRPPLAAFYAVINLASYGILLAIAAGTAQAWRDRRAFAPE
ncbi:hypothetical protein BrevBR_13120 [Brevundimonas sp. BR2-1]|uniref:hypothetical protein n=1 Tax=Brevundimonas sp. BR2-1 TaxID=3031123 RepID=UPI0030A6F694